MRLLAARYHVPDVERVAWQECGLHRARDVTGGAISNLTISERRAALARDRRLCYGRIMVSVIWIAGRAAAAARIRRPA